MAGHPQNERLATQKKDLVRRDATEKATRNSLDMKAALAATHSSRRSGGFLISDNTRKERTGHE